MVAALARRDPNSPLVFHRNGIAIRRWRTAWRTACQAPHNVASILDSARELGIRDAQASAENNENIAEVARANSFKDFASYLDRMLDELFIARMEDNEEIFSKVMTDTAFRSAAH